MEEFARDALIAMFHMVIDVRCVDLPAHVDQ